MKIIVTLSEALSRANDWEEFCHRFGWSEYACKEGGGDIEQELTEDEAEEFGFINNNASTSRTGE